MKINYQDHGATAAIIITSTVFEFRRHNRAVDAALLSGNVAAYRSGSFFMKTVISGRTTVILRAMKAIREGWQ